MGKNYGDYETSYIGGVAPNVQKHHKELKKTEFNKAIDQHRKRGQAPAKPVNSKKK